MKDYLLDAGMRCIVCMFECTSTSQFCLDSEPHKNLCAGLNRTKKGINSKPIKILTDAQLDMIP